MARRAKGRKSKAGRKPIFTPPQKRVLSRLIRAEVKATLRTAVRSL